jgi:SAM-dependent MidA family methyltransferase
MLTPLELAPLSADERAHEARVIAVIRAALAQAGGWLSFARYMDLALYAPGLGYYVAGAHKLGTGGDFVTAPELSPVFAHCLAGEVGAVLAALGGGDIVEIGAGSGALAADLLTALAEDGRLPDRYRILETSPDLRARQQARIGALPMALAGRVEWLDRIPTTPFRGALLSNEVLDALPVERFRIRGAGVEALGVAWNGARFHWAPAPADAALCTAVAALGMDLPDGYVGELCPGLGAWLDSVTAPLAAGVALLVDYGYARAEYYAPWRDGGTLGCFHRHRRHDDPFIHVGLQDLTAWVDYTAVAEAALAAGLEVAGFTTQAHFLLANGFEARLAAHRASLDEAGAVAAGQAARRLLMPAEMGERFKCIALSRDYAAPLRGFALRDFTATL